jgi:hypothetical protein
MKTIAFARGFFLAGAAGALMNVQAENKLYISDMPALVQSTQSNKRLDKEFIAMVKAPATSRDVLERMKSALDENLLVQQDFFKDENLKRFFGLTDIQSGVGAKNPGDLWAAGHDFGGIFKGAEVDGNFYHGANFSLIRSAGASGKIKGVVKLVIPGILPKPSALYFDNVENVFGKTWERINETLPDGPLPPPTGPHGNERIKYVIDDSLFNKTINVSFYGDGSLAGILISEEAK